MIKKVKLCILLPQFKNINFLKLLEKVFTQSIYLFSSFRVKLAKSIENQKFYAIKIIKRHEVESINLKAFKKILSNEVRLL